MFVHVTSVPRYCPTTMIAQLNSWFFVTLARICDWRTKSMKVYSLPWTMILRSAGMPHWPISATNWSWCPCPTPTGPICTSRPYFVGMKFNPRISPPEQMWSRALTRSPVSGAFVPEASKRSLRRRRSRFARAAGGTE